MKQWTWGKTSWKLATQTRTSWLPLTMRASKSTNWSCFSLRDIGNPIAGNWVSKSTFQLVLVYELVVVTVVEFLTQTMFSIGNRTIQRHQFLFLSKRFNNLVCKHDPSNSWDFEARQTNSNSKDKLCNEVHEWVCCQSTWPSSTNSTFKIRISPRCVCFVKDYLEF